MGAPVYRGNELQGKSLRGEDLKGAEFRECNLSGTSFAHADLTGARFYKCSSDARAPVDFERALLDQARFEGCSFRHAILAKASLCEAFLQETNLSGARLGAANLTATRFDDVDISLAHLHRLRLTDAVFSKLKWEPVQKLPRLRGVGFGRVTSAIGRAAEAEDDPKIPFLRFLRRENSKTNGLAWLAERGPWRRVFELPLILIGRSPENRLNVAATTLLGLAWLGLVVFAGWTYLHQGIAKSVSDLPIEFIRVLKGSTSRGGEMEILEYVILILGSAVLWFAGRAWRWRNGTQG